MVVKGETSSQGLTVMENSEKYHITPRGPSAQKHKFPSRVSPTSKISWSVPIKEARMRKATESY